MKPSTRYTLTLEAKGTDRLNRSPIIRLRQLLKLAGRAFNLRCVSVRQVEPGELERKLTKPHCNGQARDNTPT